MTIPVDQLADTYNAYNELLSVDNSSFSICKIYICNITVLFSNSVTCNFPNDFAYE